MFSFFFESFELQFQCGQAVEQIQLKTVSYKQVVY